MTGITVPAVATIISHSGRKRTIVIGHNFGRVFPEQFAHHHLVGLSQRQVADINVLLLQTTGRLSLLGLDALDLDLQLAYFVIELHYLGAGLVLIGILQ